MEIYRHLKEIREKRPAAVSLGFFDGLHLGHTMLLTSCVAFARERSLSADVFTFKDHPKNIMSGEIIVPRLMPESEKIDRLSSLGIDRIFEFDFADYFHTMQPEDFAKKMLAGAFSAEAVFCGFNFRFGAQASGDTESLKKLGRIYRFETHVIDPVYASDRLISSSLIRRCINNGDVELAGCLLGRDYALNGIVEKGRSLGRALGFPTANFFPDREMTIPFYGVYVTETLVDGAKYPSVSNVGVCPTVADETFARVETHILDKDIDLYDKEITVMFKSMLRKERRFKDEEALKRQIASDTDSARHYFSTYAVL